MNEATSPPKRRRVAAIPVPVPRTGPGNDSGVKANIIAYSKSESQSALISKRLHAVEGGMKQSFAEERKYRIRGQLTEISQYGRGTLKPNIRSLSPDGGVRKKEDAGQN